MTALQKWWSPGFLRRKRFWIPISLILLYHLVFNRYTGQLLLERVTPLFLKEGAFLHAEIEMFSPLYGIALKHLELGGGGEGQKPLFQAKRIELLWDLPLLLTGRIKLRAVSLDEPALYLEIVSGKGNWEEIFVSSPEPEEPKSDSEPIPDSLSTYLPVSFFLSVSIRNFSFEFHNQDSKTHLLTRDWNWDFLLDTHRFRSIPLSPEALHRIESLEFRLNPAMPVFVSFHSPALSGDNSIHFRFILEKKNSGSDRKILSNVRLGGENLEFGVPLRPPIRVSVSLDWDVSWISELDTLLLNSLSLEFQGKKWLQASGSIDQTRSQNPKFEIRLDESEIRLAELNSILQKIPGIDFTLGGVVSLAPLNVQGDSSRIELDWGAEARNLQYSPRKGDSHLLRYFKMDLHAELDTRIQQASSPENPFPILRALHLKQFNAEYNGLFAVLRGSYVADQNFFLELLVERLKLEKFVRDLSGLLEMSLTVSGANLGNLQLSGNLNLGNFRFRMDRSLSGISRHRLGIEGGIALGAGFAPKSLQIRNFSLQSSNSAGRRAFHTNLKCTLNLEGEKLLSLKNAQIAVNLPNTLPILPLSLRQNALSLQRISPEWKLRLNGELGFDTRDYRLFLLGTIPGIDLEDLKAKIHVKETGIGLDSEGWDLREISVSAYKNLLTFRSGGKLYKRPGVANPPLGGYFGNLDLDLSIRSDTPEQMTSSLNYRGNIQLKSKVRDNLIEGSLVMENVKALIQKGTCPSETCKLFLIDNLNADIPISHDLNLQKRPSLIDADKTRFIKTYGRIPRDNFSIYQVIGSHPSIPDTPFAYIKGSGNYAGLSGRIRYLENYLHIDGLKFSLLDGIVYAKDILVNVGNGEPSLIEYMGSVQIRDIDLKQLLSSSTRRIVDDGKIKVDLNFSGMNLSDPIPNMKLYFSIFQIGRDFGKSVLNILSTKGALMNYITDSYAIDKVEVELSKGLVYANVLFKKSLLSMVVSLEDSKITQSRMPLANFLKRAENEIATYK